MRTSIEIAGGGLAGLALGIALRQRGIPVTLHEAGSYPRHRVCGEFISGLPRNYLKDLGLDSCFADATPCRDTGWYCSGKKILARSLPSPGIGISRHTLDQRLAQHFRELGGTLHENKRLSPDQLRREGVIRCTGRLPSPGPWLGLKIHLQNLPLQHDLEMHLAPGAYVGLCRIGHDTVNLCGLFRSDPKVKAPRAHLPLAYLRAKGLHDLADRVQASTPDESSALGISGLSYSSAPRPPGACLGDAAGLIPPFTGNGMSIALESAALVSEPLAAYAEGKQSWDITCETLSEKIHTHFNPRKRVARVLHPILCHHLGQTTLTHLARARLLPFNTLFSLTRH